MKYRLLSTGKIRNKHIQALVADYEGRIHRMVPFESVEIADEKIQSGRPVAAIQKAEGERLLKKIPADACTVVLDEKGKQLSSVELANWIQGMESRYREMIFCIGGALGHGEEVKARADCLLSLSAMTMTHTMARLFAVEQLYRAFAIQKGLPYHNE
ncbi:23S rRNA (pseudouridine(1915)-N(3))-methyltransferase RlmH [Desulfurispirillum indicum]|uniref:Ribosomal RNA large subunit methyltransferase H n=1 Tax=Desulfurispirillum indicum (strain ATCC BAA-1389 / DSM 22839 / S5) TaxID=653733 RepID=E6W3S6_DESIS|nr:23S rRNA (pseudouridine(1915)-N(3))-methyltransferase RlmH [Desulfurispirillum indicum]ADU66957.1 protein of unknown function DUF163 [Desulfurispirillum indicum S5]UCZ56336.1 23S rRNA (pseudouridine(1915)-N(3))-methyltransferase RlmH [Desulfurispirillum indicum]